MLGYLIENTIAVCLFVPISFLDRSQITNMVLMPCQSVIQGVVVLWRPLIVGKFINSAISMTDEDSYFLFTHRWSPGLLNNAIPIAINTVIPAAVYMIMFSIFMLFYYRSRNVNCLAQDLRRTMR